MPTIYLGRSFSFDTAIGIILLVVSFVATVLIGILVVPNRAAKKGGIGSALHNIVNFKGLLIEKIIKYLYIFTTVFSIAASIYLIFKNPLTGIISLIVTPIALRLTFELLMMFILLVTNVIEIRRHLTDRPDNGTAPFSAYQQPPVQQPYAAPQTPNYAFCTRCGARYDKNAGGCPNGCDRK